MCQFDNMEVAGNKKGGRPYLPGHNFALTQMNNHLYDDSTNSEDILFLQLPPYNRIQIEIHVVKYAIEIAIVFNNLFDVGNLFNGGVVHQGYVFVFEDLLPTSLLVQFFDGEGLAGLRILGSVEGEPLGFDNTLEDAIFIHCDNFNIY